MIHQASECSLRQVGLLLRCIVMHSVRQESHQVLIIRGARETNNLVNHYLNVIIYKLGGGGKNIKLKTL